MRLAYRTRPGIPGPSRKAAIGAICLAAAAGFYGFTTSVQKAAVLRRPAGETFEVADTARMAVAAPATPSLVYAVTDAPAEPATPQPVRVAAAAPAADTTVGDDVTLIGQTNGSAAPLSVATAPLAVPPAPAASDQATSVSAIVEAQPNAPTPVIPSP